MASGFGQVGASSTDVSGSSSSSWFGGSSADSLPLFQTDNLSMPTMPNLMSFSEMKASMEAQMPKQILGMSYTQRFQVFCGLLVLSVVFFGMAFFVGLPTLVARPQKFALSFTMGSLVFMASFGILKGPMEHFKSMLHKERLPFTFLYFGSMALTLYFTFTSSGATGYVLVLSASTLQLFALLYYLISFLPGGASGLKYLTAAMAHLLKPVLMACTRFQALCLKRCLVLWYNSRGSNANAE